MRASLMWIVVAIAGLSAAPAHAQTPSPMQEWQYSGGIILARLFEPNLPTWRVVTGVAAEVLPAYDGARAYRVQGGPVIDIHYKDVAFFSTGDGLGFNLLHGDHYQMGLSVNYDSGRPEDRDLKNLAGMGDIKGAAVGKIFGSVVLSKRFPLILRADVRQFAGGAQGAIADAGVYLPLPGSSRTFVMFAGPSISVATRHYLRTMYGVTPTQSLASGHPVYDIKDAGTVAAGVGFSATKFLTEHWLLNVDAALSQIRGSPAHSPLIERHTQRILAISCAYQW